MKQAAGIFHDLITLPTYHTISIIIIKTITMIVTILITTILQAAGIFHHLITLPTYHTAALSTDHLAKGSGVLSVYTYF